MVAMMRREHCVFFHSFTGAMFLMHAQYIDRPPSGALLQTTTLLTVDGAIAYLKVRSVSEHEFMEVCPCVCVCVSLCVCV